MHRVCIRQAIDNDISQLCALLESLFSQESDFTPDAAKQACGLRLIMERPGTGQIHCAEADDRIVGMVSLLFTVSTAEGGLAAWLEDMFVHPDYRGMGVGEQLLQEAIRSARDAGCLRITLLTDSDNESAMRFYSRSGFSRSQMTPFRIKL